VIRGGTAGTAGDAREPFAQPHLPGLDGLRFTAALLVALMHGLLAIAQFRETPAYLDQVWQLAGLGMDLFFVLSGFVIHYTYSRTVGTAAGFRNFFAARLARLYPLYILLFSSELVLTAWSGQATPFGHDWRALPFYLTLTQSWTYLVFNDASLVYQFGEIAQVSWSISTEAWLYLCYPIVAAALLRIRRPATTVVALVAWLAVAAVLLMAVASRSQELSAAIGLVLGELADGRTSINAQDSLVRWLLTFSPYARVFQFVTGAVFAQLLIQLAAVPVGGSERRAGLALSVGAIAIMLASYRPSPIAAATSGMGMLTTSACGLLIFCCARYANPVTSAFRLRGLAAAGNASYSLYLLHMPVFTWFRRSPVDATAANQAARLALLAALLAGLVLVSLAVYRLFEAPARRWVRSGVRLPAFGPVFGARSRALAAWTGTMAALAVPLASVVVLGVAVRAAAMAATEAEPVRDGTIDVLSATYGGNCRTVRDNALQSARQSCRGLARCDYAVSVATLGDPSPGCAKDFRVTWRCLGVAGTRTAEVPAEAGFRSIARLEC
jgi:peptidoglycan/LPS O-acetylase OafA/YrhL